jgi:hypothetical protein
MQPPACPAFDKLVADIFRLDGAGKNTSKRHEHNYE